MSKKSDKPSGVVLRFDSDAQRLELKAEAADFTPRGISLNSYILHLLDTHPDRVKRKPKAKR